MTPSTQQCASERGFSMVLVIMMMITTALFVAGGFAAANGDLPVARDSQDRKAAYAAAESAINFYQHHLNRDNDYWLKCANVPAPNATELNPVNLAWNGNGTGTDPRRWRNIAGSEAQYTIELLPAPGQTSCQEGVASSMLDPASGTFRIRATGRPNARSSLRRSVIASFRRVGFLDFLYFTHRETQDPMAYPVTASNGRTRDWALANCAEPRLRSSRDPGCVEIQFPSIDSLNGPLHTNDDSVYVCGSPVFGRNAGDKLEVSGTVTTKGWQQNPKGSGCSGEPILKAPFRVGAKPMSLPPSNLTLKAVAASGGLLLTGKTTVRLDGTTMYVTNAAKGWNDTPVAWPANGVLYVDKSSVAGSCTATVPPVQANYAEGEGCAKLYVSGEYGGDLTLASADDIIVKSPDGTSDPDLTRRNGGDHVLGLVAENYVRVYHRTKDCNENVNAMENVTIEAAILSVKHSFIVDNYACGPKLGKLNVMGAIAQMYRGPVGTGGASSAATGYAKNYWYDDRLRFRTPPYFLNPVEVTWKVLRTNEQVPPTK